jgi:aspartyl-tRNA(Asn)/glutamyl-tRNA(Gln) amidotransferase subunit B
VEKGTVSFSQASGRIFAELLSNPDEEPLAIAQRLNLLQQSDSHTLEVWVDGVLDSLPEKVKEYRSGKKGLLGLFAGEVKKRSRGKADMENVMRILQEKLGR